MTIILSTDYRNHNDEILESLSNCDKIILGVSINKSRK